MTDTDPTRVVADADVLAADLLVGAAARDALDRVREHSWMTLVASDPLLEDAKGVVAELANSDLAADWRDRIDGEREGVDHPEGDHPGLASVYRGGAAHLLTYDEGLGSAAANLSLQPHLQVSIRTPHAFASLFDPVSLYEATHDRSYSGPDRDPRS
jgi:hypothetical protein